MVFAGALEYEGGVSRQVLITGGAGFIGCELGHALAAQGFEVHAFDNLHPQVHTTLGAPKRLAPGVSLHLGDVTSADNLRALFQLIRPPVIVHLAAETGTGQSLTQAARHAGVNALGTAQLLDALSAAGHRPEQLLLASSRAVYGDGAWQEPGGPVFYPVGRTRADLEARSWNPRGPSGRPGAPLPSVAGQTSPNPISVYGATKLVQEQMLAAWCRAFGVPLTVLRLQNVYGAGQALGNPYTGVLTFFARTVHTRGQLDVYEDGEIVRDFVHVDDVVQAMVKALAQPVAGVRTFDIGSGAPTTIHQVAQLMAKKASAPPPQVSGRFRDGDVRAASCQIDAARRELGYAPKVSLSDGLDRLLAHVAHVAQLGG